MTGGNRILGDNSVFAVLKFSYNNPGDASVVGGVCGTGFFVGPGVAVTANHVLDEPTFTPNPGYRRCQVWLATRRGRALALRYHQILAHPELDATIIRIDDAELKMADWPHRAAGGTLAGRAVLAFGHIGGSMPGFGGVGWRDGSLHFESVDLDSVVSDRSGRVIKDLRLSVRADNIHIEKVRGFELSFGSRVGMSGGPVVDAASGELLGMMLTGLPPDAPIKTQTFAISIGQILQLALPGEAAR